jgi:hypothetical protein
VERRQNGHGVVVGIRSNVIEEIRHFLGMRDNVVGHQRGITSQLGLQYLEIFPVVLLERIDEDEVDSNF